MRAALFTGERELKLEQMDIPIPKDNEMVIKIVACGICHTDEGYIEGTPTYQKPPIILGHEASGTVFSMGDNVANFTIGDAVLIPPVLTCGYCRFCQEGRETLCKNQLMLGNHINGAFAEFTVVPAKDIVKVPSSLNLADISIVSDAIATPYHAVINRAKVKPGDVVAVIGCGGVGINVVQFAAMMGAKVIAIDIQNDKLELAKTLGADITINPNEVDLKKSVREFSDHVEYAFEVVGNPKTQQMAFSLLGRGGTLVTVGYSPKLWDGFQSGKVMYFELNVIGSLGCPPRDFPRILSLIERGKIKLTPLITHRYSLDEINSAFEMLRSGKALRILIEM